MALAVFRGSRHHDVLDDDLVNGSLLQWGFPLLAAPWLYASQLATGPARGLRRDGVPGHAALRGGRPPRRGSRTARCAGRPVGRELALEPRVVGAAAQRARPDGRDRHSECVPARHAARGPAGRPARPALHRACAGRIRLREAHRVRVLPADAGDRLPDTAGPEPAAGRPAADRRTRLGSSTRRGGRRAIHRRPDHPRRDRDRDRRPGLRGRGASHVPTATADGGRARRPPRGARVPTAVRLACADRASGAPGGARCPTPPPAPTWPSWRTSRRRRTSRDGRTSPPRRTPRGCAQPGSPIRARPSSPPTTSWSAMRCATFRRARPRARCAGGRRFETSSGERLGRSRPPTTRPDRPSSPARDPALRSAPERPHVERAGPPPGYFAARWSTRSPGSSCSRWPSASWRPFSSR